jgi:hypothetical protein
VHSPGSTSSPRARRARTSERPCRMPRASTVTRSPPSVRSTQRMSPSAVPSSRTICQSALAPGRSVPLIRGPVNVQPVSGTIPAVARRRVAELERLADHGLRAVDRRQARRRKPEPARPATRRVVLVRLERRHGDAHPVGERERAEKPVELRPAVGAVQPEGAAPARSRRRPPEPHEVPRRGQLRRGGRLAAPALLDLGAVRPVGDLDAELDQELHVGSSRPRRRCDLDGGDAGRDDRMRSARRGARP